MTEQLHRLIADIEHYLSALEGPGIAEMRDALITAKERQGRPVKPQLSPMCETHLPAALAALAVDGHASLASAIKAVAGTLNWVTYDAYPRDEIGIFAERHAFASLIGEGAAFPAEDFDLGLFVIAPDTFYPDHCHKAPEVYVPVTGPHRWRFDSKAEFMEIPAHQPIWNPPWQPHATFTGSVPFLCIFAWLKDVNDPARICR